MVAVPSLHLCKVKSELRNCVHIAAQDVGVNSSGAFTGEISAQLLVDCNINWTLTGHSERRIGFGFPVCYVFMLPFLSSG